MIEMRDDELLIERQFDAPLALVFRLWQERDHMIRWWGPEEFTTVELDWKLIPGRPWSGAMTSKQYGLSRFAGVIRQVDLNKRILFTFQWVGDDSDTPETVVTVEFSEREGKTLQSFHQAPFESIASRDSHIGGWNSLFNKQQLYAENVAFAMKNGVRP